MTHSLTHRHGLLRCAVACAFAATLVPAYSAGADDDLMKMLLRIQKKLREHSSVNDWTEDGETGQILSTTLKISSKAKELILVYERTYSTHEGDHSHFTLQNIEYTLKLEALDPDSVTVEKLEDTLSKKPLWLVWVSTQGEKETIRYSNLFEIQDSEGLNQASTSKGTVAKVTLGYFLEPGLAEDVAQRLRDAIEARLRA